jgi:hypothetical protein
MHWFLAPGKYISKDNHHDTEMCILLLACVRSCSKRIVTVLVQVQKTLKTTNTRGLDFDQRDREECTLRGRAWHARIYGSFLAGVPYSVNKPGATARGETKGRGGGSRRLASAPVVPSSSARF